MNNPLLSGAYRDEKTAVLNGKPEHHETAAMFLTICVGAILLCLVIWLMSILLFGKSLPFYVQCCCTTMPFTIVMIFIHRVRMVKSQISTSEHVALCVMITGVWIGNLLMSYACTHPDDCCWKQRMSRTNPVTIIMDIETPGTDRDGRNATSFYFVDGNTSSVESTVRWTSDASDLPIAPRPSAFSEGPNLPNALPPDYNETCSKPERCDEIPPPTYNEAMQAFNQRT